MGYYCSRS